MDVHIVALCDHLSLILLLYQVKPSRSASVATVLLKCQVNRLCF